MKTVRILNIAPFDAVNVIKERMEFTPQGVNYKTMRQRVRVIEAFEAARFKETVDLEDADFETLKNAIENENSSTLCRRELLDVLEAAITPVEKEAA